MKVFFEIEEEEEEGGGGERGKVGGKWGENSLSLSLFFPALKER